jgi:hypothetical protein
MAALNEVQRLVLERMQGYRVIMQYTHGAVLVAPPQEYQHTQVIETDGAVCSLERYLDRRKQPSRHRGGVAVQDQRPALG